jgi:hypothetical protein
MVIIYSLIKNKNKKERREIGRANGVLVLLEATTYFLL